METPGEGQSETAKALSAHMTSAGFGEFLSINAATQVVKTRIDACVKSTKYCPFRKNLGREWEQVIVYNFSNSYIYLFS
jgi:hypothetical protein